MIKIENLLLRFNNILLSEKLKKNIIIDILNKTIKLQIKNKDIQIKNNIIYLNIKSIYKNEILFKREIILEEFKKALNKKIPQNII